MKEVSILIVDILTIFLYNKDSYGNNCRMASNFKEKPEMPKKAVIYENVKILGGLIAALTVVIGIAINIFTLPQRVTVVETKVSQSENRIALIEAKLDSLIADNKEIKNDIKELLRKNH